MFCNKLKILSVVCLCACILSGCNKTSYVIKPSGTNDTQNVGTFVVPEKYQQTDVIEEVTTSEEVAVATTDTKVMAQERLEKYETLLASNTLYVDIQRVRTYGDSVESARLVCAFTETDDVYYAAYNSSNELVQEVYGNGDTVYLLNHTDKQRLETTRSKYKYCDKATVQNFCTVNNLTYVNTYEDELEGRTLLCDEYTADDSIVRYYYDTADNLIVLRVTTAEDDVNTLFNELKTFVDSTTWEQYTEYEVAQLID